LTDLFRAAVPTLTEKCFVPKAAESANEYDAASSKKIVANHQSLLRDLPRLQDIVSIARNALTIGDFAQNAAAKAQLDAAIFDVITLCIKVTARGFSSEGSQVEEEKWQSVIEEFKKLMVRCLQFVNNLVAQNERRKLMLWVELFDSSTEGILSTTELPKMLEVASGECASMDESAPDMLTTPKTVSTRTTFSASPSTFPINREATTEAAKGITDLLTNPFLLYFGSVGIEVRKDLEREKRSASAVEIAAECKTRWDNEPQERKQEWVELYSHLTARSRELGLQAPSAPLPSGDFAPPPGFNLQAANETLRSIADQLMSLQKETGGREGYLPLKQGSKFNDLAKEITNEGLPFSAFISVLDEGKYMPMSSEVPGPEPHSDYFKMTCSPEYGFGVLERGKLDLLRRLEPESDKTRPVSVEQTQAPINSCTAESVVREQADTDSIEPNNGSEEEESDDDYSDAIPGDNNRGLLTDVPLVLGPGEVEVLPMIIQSAIVPPEDPSKPGYGSTAAEITAIKNMHIVRCHLLLAQDNGRNLLRELLIFIAAWDLREDELYFKLMANIMQSILLNGLMPFSYHGFRESKDIVSPAQAVIMKLLTGIFRKRQSAALKAEETQPETPLGEESDVGEPAYPSRLEVHMVNFLFTEFRRAIVPQTCALIFLQGKIRSGVAGPEDFPLNLWDMERMYEGIYQYLEFLAILTEHRTWKVMMSEWDITSELVTLLEELDAAIPRSTLKSQQALKSFHGQKPVPAEQPYNPTQGTPNLTPQTSIPPQHVADNYPLGPAEEEPCNFEWRNLKKLAVLVLSSMVWHNPRVQQQLGAPDAQGRPGRGVRALLNCCKIDDFNPYVKEHAVMALRFALEECDANQQIVRDLNVPESLVPAGKAPTTGQKRIAQASVDLSGERYILDGVEVPKEVLDLNGYETFVDQNGNVQLRKRPSTSPH
jgi:palmitoyltransferase